MKKEKKIGLENLMEECEKVDDIGYMAGAKAVFTFIKPFIEKTLYDKMFNEFFQIYSIAVYKAIAKNLCVEVKD